MLSPTIVRCRIALRSAVRIVDRMPGRVLAALLLALACAPGTRVTQRPPQDAAPDRPSPGAADPVAAMQRALAAYGKRDYAGYLRYVRAAAALAPEQPAISYYLARGLAVTGDTAGALRALEQLAPLGAAEQLTRDSAFAALRGLPAFQTVVQRLTANAAPLVRSDTAFTVAGHDLLPESVAYDSVDRAFYLGSLAQYKIVRVSDHGATSDFVRLGPAGAGEVLGMKIDAPRRRLWAAVFTHDSAAPRSATGDAGWAAVHVYELTTGRLLARYAPADSTTPHLINDLVLTASGDAYATDTPGAAVYRISYRAGGAIGRLERLAGSPARFTYANGITLSPDGARLYVAHLEGVSVWDVRSGRPAAPLAHPPGVTTTGVDGLYAHCGTLIAIQRVVGFDQVARLRLSPSGRAVVGAEVLERRHPAHEQPTTGVLVGDTLYYIANSQVARLGPGGTLAPAARPAGTVILRLPFGASNGCRALRPA